MVSLSVERHHGLKKSEEEYQSAQELQKLQGNLRKETQDGNPAPLEDSDWYPSSDEEAPKLVLLSKGDTSKEHNKILEKVDKGEFPLDSRRDCVRAVKENRKLFITDGTGKSTLLHKLVSHPEKFEKRKELLKLLLRLDPTLLSREDSAGQTPLFQSVQGEHEEIVRFIFENVSAEKVMVALRKSSKTEGNCLHIAIKEDLPFLNDILTRIGQDEEVFNQIDEDGNTPLHVAVDYTRCKPGQFDLVKRLVKSSRATLAITNKNGQLPPLRYHIHTRCEEEKKKNDLRGIMKNPEADKIEELLRLESMRNRSRNATRTLLYGTGQSKQPFQNSKETDYSDNGFDLRVEREIEFSLSGYTVLSKKALDYMKDHLKFERILQYVAILSLRVECSEVKDLPSGAGRTDYCTIFQWLRDHNVKRIFKVVVQDDHPVSTESLSAHSEAAIEHSLQGFGIEIWDWQKLDIDIRTIQNVAPNVREVHLYSSGNPAVMRGWSDSQGLSLLKKGLEPLPNTELNVESFKNRVATKRLQVDVPPSCDFIKNVATTRGPEMNKEQIKEKQRWLDCIDEFEIFIKNYTRVLLNSKSQDHERQRVSDPKNIVSLEQIRVALIDDGVDATYKELGRSIADGETFCASNGVNGLYSAYYQSSGGHGTLMATLIRRVCPNVQLYVAKLDEQQTDVGKLSFTVKSAAEAIQWAIKSDVHIISMSWTIEKTDTKGEDIKELTTAIRHAVDKGILLFCAAEDMGNVSTTGETYPRSCWTDRIFTIGAATAAGNRWEWTGQGKVDYILPGHEILVERQQGTIGQQKVRSGSSLATALAAGLAGLILHSVELCDHDSSVLLRDHDRMNKAFKNMTNGGSNEFIRVWTVFQKHLQARRHVDGEKEVLEKVMRALLN